MSVAAVRGDSNKLLPVDRPAHDWYRFVLSFPPHLVRQYLDKFGFEGRHTVLDPFCGTGTTLVECKKNGISSVGLEANPLAHFASTVKLDWQVSGQGMVSSIKRIAEATLQQYATDGLNDEPMPLFERAGKAKSPVGKAELRSLPPESFKLLLADSISPLPLHKTLTLLDFITHKGRNDFRRHEQLALAKAIVNSISNLHFGPEVGVGPKKHDTAVVSAWAAEASRMARDLNELRDRAAVSSVVHLADARQIKATLKPRSVDGVITSPPYPNEKDYTRTTRLESVLLGFIRNKEELRSLKRGLVKSNTRGVYTTDNDDHWIANHREIQNIAQAIEARRIELGKTSGFERMYGRVTKLYFGGMARHLSELTAVLKPGAMLAYVVGDQASYLRVMIRTGQLLADIAQSLGYKVVGIDLFRTRLATATREQLREEVVVLQWPGKALAAHPTRKVKPAT